jgi:hypothetical protein
VDFVLPIAVIAILVAIIWIVRQGPPKDGDALPDNRNETNLGGS